MLSISELLMPRSLLFRSLVILKRSEESHNSLLPQNYRFFTSFQNDILFAIICAIILYKANLLTHLFSLRSLEFVNKDNYCGYRIYDNNENLRVALGNISLIRNDKDYKTGISSVNLFNSVGNILFTTEE